MSGYRGVRGVIQERHEGGDSGKGWEEAKGDRMHGLD